MINKHKTNFTPSAKKKNTLHIKVFKDLSVNGKQIPVSFLRYNGKETTYITYQEIMVDEVLSADDEIVNYSDC